MVVSAAMTKDWVITAEVRVMETVATAEEMETNMDNTAGKWVHVGDKSIHPIMTTTNKYRFRSAVIRPTITEVGWDNRQS